MSRMSHRMRVISGGRMLHMSPLPVRVTDRTRRGRPSLSEIAPRQERSDFFSRRHVGGSGLSPWRRSARQVECRPGHLCTFSFPYTACTADQVGIRP
ncbi:hypothetical protein MTP99_016211 [Tenebrio molitor]|nr:hypothetical protein MTP99_016211 [Tenebrio molitor]